MARAEITGPVARWFRAVWRRKPKENEVFSVRMDGELLGLAVGRVHLIEYAAGGEIHRHVFEHRPLLVVSSDGYQTFVVKGRHRFTERGFVG
jgi:hypothetical protein